MEIYEIALAARSLETAPISRTSHRAAGSGFENPFLDGNPGDRTSLDHLGIDSYMIVTRTEGRQHAVDDRVGFDALNEIQ